MADANDKAAIPPDTAKGTAAPEPFADPPEAAPAKPAPGPFVDPPEAAPAKTAPARSGELTAFRSSEITKAVAGSAAGRTTASSTAAAPRSPRQALAPAEVPHPPRAARASKRARNPIVIVGSALMTLFIVFGLLGLAVISVGETMVRKPGPLAADKVVTIPRNLGIRDIGELLAREGVVEQPWLFIGAVVAMQARQELKAGEYMFPRQASVRDVIGVMVDGKTILHQVTIPEGLTSEQVVARLLENDILTGSVREIPPEGSLLPETYRFSRGMTREQLLQKMVQDQRRIVQEAWAKRAPDLPLKSPEELVVLASIVEKETGKGDERARVAAVFVNRLNRRMKLESDPTIIYGLVGGRGSLGRGILASEIRKPTAYNTYVIDGLPPGPIANPGRAAIEATANPARTRELFFVADGTGGHAFAETYEQHQRNVARWREIERAQQTGSAVPPPAAAETPASAAAPAAPAATPPAAPRAAQPAPQQRVPTGQSPPPAAPRGPPAAQGQPPGQTRTQ